MDVTISGHEADDDRPKTKDGRRVKKRASDGTTLYCKLPRFVFQPQMETLRDDVKL